MTDGNKPFFTVGNYLVLVPIALLMYAQVPHLKLPYFWDEAWSYMAAVRKMAEAGPSIMPGAVPLEYCKGHPQLFYFIAACWFNTFPCDIFYMRLFPLVFSIVLLIAFYFGLRKVSNPTIARMGVVLLGVQSMFLAQSIMVLPEMMLSLWLILAFFAFIRSNYKIYALWGSLMVMTKETAMIFAAVFVLCYLTGNFEKIKDRNFVRNLSLVVSPLMVYFVFLVFHKLAFGVFFYQEHLGYISFRWDTMWRKLGSAFVTAFVHYGRLSLLLFLIGAIFFLLWKKIRLKNRNALVCLAIMIPSYLIFLSLNFYSPRYTLSILILMILSFSMLFESIPLSTGFKWVTVILISSVCLFYSLNSKREIDIDLGYVEVIDVNKKMVRYCEKMGFYNDPIAASFNINIGLKDKNAGFLSGERIFTNVAGLDRYMQARYVMYETTTEDNQNITWKIGRAHV